MSARFDPYEQLDALERAHVAYVVIGAVARVIHGSGETTHALDITPSIRDDNRRRLTRALADLQATHQDGHPAELLDDLDTGEPLRVTTRAGDLVLVPHPWGTKGYDAIRRRQTYEPVGNRLRIPVASLTDLGQMLAASPRPEDHDRLHRLQRLLALDRRLGRGISR
ncbi:MAG: hypothetical protein R3C15_23830 [Thermoleophilia bacterium]